MGFAIEWASLHAEESLREWELARADQLLFPIDPL
jgi:hypothetical protein